MLPLEKCQDCIQEIFHHTFQRYFSHYKVDVGAVIQKHTCPFLLIFTDKEISFARLQVYELHRILNTLANISYDGITSFVTCYHVASNLQCGIQLMTHLTIQSQQDAVHSLKNNPNINSHQRAP